MARADVGSGGDDAVEGGSGAPTAPMSPQNVAGVSDVVARHRASIDAAMAALRVEMQLLDRTIDSVATPRIDLYLSELGARQSDSRFVVLSRFVVRCRRAARAEGHGRQRAALARRARQGRPRDAQVSGAQQMNRDTLASLVVADWCKRVSRDDKGRVGGGVVVAVRLIVGVVGVALVLRQQRCLAFARSCPDATSADKDDEQQCGERGERDAEKERLDTRAKCGATRRDGRRRGARDAVAGRVVGHESAFRARVNEQTAPAAAVGALAVVYHAAKRRS